MAAPCPAPAQSETPTTFPGAYLVSDKRERDVIPHITPLLPNAHLQQQINTGDFLICKEGRILACFERKTLKDFAASITDGRYENRKKMFELRDQCGCQLYYIVEGTPFPKPTMKVSRGITYQAILTAMTTLPMASGVHIVQTSDARHTAERLRDFTRAADRLMEVYRYPVTPAGGGEVPETAAALVPASVLGVYQKDPDTLCVDLWSALTGISLTTAKLITRKFSVEEFFAQPVAEITALRSANGKRLKEAAYASLRGLHGGDNAVGLKMLSKVNGIGGAMAAQIFDGVPNGHKLKALCSWNCETIGMITVNQKGRSVRVGKARAMKILKLLKHKSTDASCAGGGLPPPDPSLEGQGRVLGRAPRRADPPPPPPADPFEKAIIALQQVQGQMPPPYTRSPHETPATRGLQIQGPFRPPPHPQYDQGVLPPLPQEEQTLPSPLPGGEDTAEAQLGLMKDLGLS